MNPCTVHIDGVPSNPAELLELWPQLFPAPGSYRIEYVSDAVLKAAAGAEISDEFESWFLRALEQKTREGFVSSQRAIWEVLDDLLRRRGLATPSGLDPAVLHQALFDLSTASTARLTGMRIPLDTLNRVSALGFTPREALDFPALAYRMGLLYTRLEKTTPVQWGELVELARQHPLSAGETAAVVSARARAGIFLKPAFDRTGNLWTAERELFPLRRITSEGIAQRASIHQMERELSADLRAEGIVRDASRVIRTEIAEHRSQGSWVADSQRWSPEAKLFRQTSATPCKTCLRLFKNPDGTPRLYTRQEVEEAAGLGPNTGPSSEWHITIGPVHPHCVCPQWTEYHPAMAPLFEGRAPEYRELMEKLGVFRDAA